MSFEFDADSEWAELLCWLETKQSTEVNEINLSIIVVGESSKLVSNVWHGCDLSCKTNSQIDLNAESEGQDLSKSLAEDWIFVEKKPAPATCGEKSRTCGRHRGLL